MRREIKLKPDIAGGLSIKFTAGPGIGNGFGCRDIRGAIIWPGTDNPGYFCIFGQDDVLEIGSGKAPLHLLYEYEDHHPSRLLKKLIEQARIMSCKVVYGDLKEKNKEFITLFRDYARFNRGTTLKLEPAGFSQIYKFGITLIQEWSADRSLDIPDDSILAKELAQMDRDDLPGSPEELFYAVNALRYIIGSVEKIPWHPVDFFGNDTLKTGGNSLEGFL